MTRFALLAALMVSPLLAAPQLKPKRASSLVGTKWVGNSLEKQTMTFEFLAEGRVNVVYNGNKIDRAGWKQEGENIYFQLNDAYCEFKGKIVGTRIVGQCYNVADQRWDVVFERDTREK